MAESAILRVLDANANRAAEGMRVVEDYLRFVLEDRFLTGLYKQLRHDLATAMSAIPAGQLIKSRETQSDIGTAVTATDEYHRPSSLEVVIANQKRIEQSLRSIEEYAKSMSPEVAAAVEKLRYRAYTLAQATLVTNASGERLATARLYVLVDGAADNTTFIANIQMLITAGADVLQLRDKSLVDRDLLARARELREATRGTETVFIMNDRPDLAVLSNADGVHIGQEELTVKDARTIVGPTRLVGVSTHSLAQARQAVLDGADYIGCGPTFPTPTKQFENFPGPEFLRDVASEISLPAFAIGGITAANIPQVLATGIRRVAVSSAVTQSANPATEVRRLRSLLDR